MACIELKKIGTGNPEELPIMRSGGHAEAGLKVIKHVISSLSARRNAVTWAKKVESGPGSKAMNADSVGHPTSCL